MRHPEDYDSPCSAVWRAFYSDERYEPDQEERERAARLMQNQRLSEWAKNTDNPFRAALNSTLKALPR